MGTEKYLQGKSSGLIRSYAVSGHLTLNRLQVITDHQSKGGKKGEGGHLLKEAMVHQANLRIQRRQRPDCDCVSWHG
ncbi:MAG: hypothetical protein ACPGUY_01990 [Akkermansiaceae bacterium]